MSNCKIFKILINLKINNWKINIKLIYLKMNKSKIFKIMMFFKINNWKIYRIMILQFKNYNLKISRIIRSLK